MMEKTKVTTRLTLDDFRKVNFHLLYRKGVSKFTLGVGIFVLIGTMTFYLMDPSYYAQFPFILK